MNSPSASRTVLIAGGGIAGLTCALCLARSGLRVDIFEQAEGYETVGAGLQISPNAFHILAELGLAERLKEAATGPLAVRVMSATNGREIASIPLGATAIERYGAPYLVVHRADLQQILARAVHDHPDIKLHLNSRMEDFIGHTNGVTALVYRGGHLSEVAGQAVVAADGVWSSLRTRHFESGPPRFSGLVAWRGLIATDQLPGSRDLENMQLWLAPKAHAVSYPIRGGRHLNVVAITKSEDGEPDESERRHWARPALASELAGALEGWDKDFLTLLQYRTKWTRWPLYTAPTGGHRAHETAALIGDAAHAMLPFAAQGAAMGIEDAAVLANCVSRFGLQDAESAFAAFEKLRTARTRRTIRLARVNRWIYHLPKPVNMIRNLTMRVLGGRRLLARQDWLYGWRTPMPSTDFRAFHSLTTPEE